MPDPQQPNIELSKLICPECGAIAKRVITWAYNPNPEHGVLAENAHGISGPATIQVEFECANGHVKFEREAVLHPRASR
jgi:hypothetical protein